MREKSNGCLFIGGPYDGKRIPVHRKNVPFQVPIALHEGPRFIDMAIHVYYPEKIMTGDFSEWVIFRHENLTLDEMFEMLVDGYVGQEAK